VASGTFVPVPLRSTRSTRRLGQKENGGWCANTVAAVQPLKLIQGMAPGGSATTSPETIHEGVLLMASVPAVQHNTTAAQGVPDPQPELFRSPPDPATTLPAMRAAAAEADVSTLARLLYLATCATYGITDDWLTARQIATTVGGLTSHGVRYLLGELAAARLLTSRRATVEHRGRRVVRQVYRLIPPEAAR